MREGILLFLTTFLICSISYSANFTEDFESGMEGWVVIDEPPELLNDKGPSNWNVSAGPFSGKALNQSSNIWGDPGDVVALGTFCIYDKAEWKDFELTFDVQANDNDGWGVVWGWKSRTDHYRFFTMSDAGNPGNAAGAKGDPGKAPWSLIEKRVGDQLPYYKTLAIERQSAYQQGLQHTFRIVVKEGKFEVYSDKKLAVNAKDPSYNGGKIGFTLYAQSGIFFDNVQVNEIGASVDKRHKVSLTWGKIKSEAF